MASSHRCPECNALLKFANPVAPGKKVRCTQCQAVFAVAGENGSDAADEEGIQPRPKVGAAGRSEESARRQPRRWDDDDEEDRPRQRRPRDEEDGDRPRERSSRWEDEDEADDRPRRRQKANSGQGLMIGLIAGGALLVIGLGVGAFFLFSKGSSTKEAEWIIGE